jgi:hypothetical protein
MPDDAQRHVEFFNQLEVEDIRSRVFTPLREIDAGQRDRGAP